MSSKSLPYRRNVSGGEFAAPRVLDVDALRRMWQPWITMTSEESTHLLARNASVIWHHVCPTDPDDVLARPWTAMYGSGGLRRFVVGQARTSDHLAEPTTDCPPAMAEFRATWSGWLHGDDPLRRLQAVALLGTLTATLPVLDTPEPDVRRGGPVHQHYCYERAKAIRSRDTGHAPSDAVMEYLARHADEPAVRMLATISMVAVSIRLRRSPQSAAGWLRHGESLLPELAAHHPAWLGLLLQTRFYRVAALDHATREEGDAALAALRRASDAGRGLRDVVGDSPVLHHLWLETHRLLLESRVKYQVGRGDPQDVLEAVAELDVIEPHYPESRLPIGELHAGVGNLKEAAVAFEQAAAGGEIRGAVAAYRAYECHRELGDTDRARRSLDLLHDLDPAADTSGLDV
ncbi:hypothetical protein OK074_1782 [Actinobacteria bacterium OK074]|nr:hypothetical protein OK074_1782 [Actinobacteria bacterium OK074]